MKNLLEAILKSFFLHFFLVLGFQIYWTVSLRNSEIKLETLKRSDYILPPELYAVALLIFGLISAYIVRNEDKYLRIIYLLLSLLYISSLNILFFSIEIYEIRIYVILYTTFLFSYLVFSIVFYFSKSPTEN